MITFFLQKKIKQLSKGYVRKKTFREYADIRQVMVLFNREDLEVVKTFADQLMSDGKQVTAYTFDNEPDKKVKKPALPDCYRILTKKDLNFFLLPHHEVVTAFKEYQTDTLIDLTVKPSFILKYLFLNSSADFRVGFNQEDGLLFDLLIEREEGQDLAFFVNQMLFYMKSLRTK